MAWLIYLDSTNAAIPQVAPRRQIIAVPRPTRSQRRFGRDPVEAECPVIDLGHPRPADRSAREGLDPAQPPQGGQVAVAADHREGAPRADAGGCSASSSTPNRQQAGRSR